MFGLGHHDSANAHTAARTVKLVKDVSAQPAVSLSKVETQGGISLKKKAEAVGISLTKANMAGIRAQVVVVLDHSGSMRYDYENGKVQDLTERFLAFGLNVDLDGEVPVIPFDDRVKNIVNVNLSNYKNVVQDKIFNLREMGSTNLTAALEEVRSLAKKTDAPLFVAIVTDGEPNNRDTAREIVKDLARYPVFIKFLAVRPVSFLQELDDLPATERLLDNVDTKSYSDLSSVSDEQFADDMVDEWNSWVAAATAAGILTDS